MQSWRSYRMPTVYEDDAWGPKYLMDKPSMRVLAIEPFDGGMCSAEWFCTDEQDAWMLAHDDVEALTDA